MAQAFSVGFDPGQGVAYSQASEKSFFRPPVRGGPARRRRIRCRMDGRPTVLGAGSFDAEVKAIDLATEFVRVRGKLPGDGEYLGRSSARLRKIPELTESLFKVCQAHAPDGPRM
jgi:hypothetical protein